MILVTGATGFIGRRLIERLMAARLPVRCLLSPYEIRRISWDTDSNAAPEIFEGTVLDEEAVFRAMSGVHTIIHLANAQWWGRERDLERVEVAGTRNIITAARAARVGRIVTMSQPGAAPSSAYTLHRIKGQVEEVIRNGGLAYTIIRSGIVFGEDDAFVNHIAMILRSNPFFFLMPGYGEITLHPIYVDDVIEVIMRALENLNVIDRTVDIGGAEYTSFRDLVLTVMRVTGMHRSIISVPPYMMRAISIVYNRIFPRSLMTPQWLDILATNRIARTGSLYEYFGFQPHRFEDTLLTYLPQRNHAWQLIRNAFRRRPRGV
ncbi:MAG: SDR family oxidoreductase [Aggregatilineales bacterium]